MRPVTPQALCTTQSVWARRRTGCTEAAPRREHQLTLSDSAECSDANRIESGPIDGLGVPLAPLAAEIVACKGHDHGVDWWALGILIYELINGTPPFASNNPMCAAYTMHCGHSAGLVYCCAVCQCANAHSRIATECDDSVRRFATGTRIR